MTSPSAPSLSSKASPAALNRALTLLPGSALSAVVAAAAALVASRHGGPVFLYALMIGVALHHLSHEPRSTPGIKFCARACLRLGVGLLGARITAQQVMHLGWSTALLVAAGVVSTIVLGLAIGRRLGFTSAQGVLAGGAVAICGASAALAISAVLPRDKNAERHTLMVVVAVTLLSTVAMVAYPLIASAVGLPAREAGIFIGATIHDVAQVIGAGYTLGPEAGDIATIVKLFRVAMLTVVVFAISLAFKRARAAAQPHAEGGRAVRSAPLVPWFLVLFVAMVAVNSSGVLPPAAVRGLGETSQVLLVVAVAALGMKTSFRDLAKAGWRPVALILVETAWLAALVLACLVGARA
ncbi:YeiH family protein [Variovorax sp. KK3]|uniref:YeiH family protein n=1 Tax=Variovorax sp. KK3 TaxID=1855728 RepID=UPI00097C7DAF|nr:putative sulfate exporter family transporter [Variovorax sp. KK3]